MFLNCPPSLNWSAWSAQSVVQFMVAPSLVNRWTLKPVISSVLNLGSCIVLATIVACSSDFVSILEKYVAMYRVTLKLGNGMNGSAGISHDISCTGSVQMGGGWSSTSDMKSSLSSCFGTHVGAHVYRWNMPSLLVQVWNGCGHRSGRGLSMISRVVEQSSCSDGVGKRGGTWSNVMLPWGTLSVR